jgi:hypothetical protein
MYVLFSFNVFYDFFNDFLSWLIGYLEIISLFLIFYTFSFIFSLIKVWNLLYIITINLNVLVY